jgi:hypothetical protein
MSGFEPSLTHSVPTPSPLPQRVAKASRNHLNEEITPLLPTGMGERCSQTISNLGRAMGTPPINEVLN